MDRRSLLAGIGWIVASSASAQSQRRTAARLGILMDLPATDANAIARVGALINGLAALGWKVGSTLNIDIRWGAESTDQRRRDAAALVQAGPDVLMTSATPPTREIQRLTRDIPVVFTTVIDPIGAGFVESFAKPGGNITGFTNFEPALSGKWVELLLEIEPRTETVIVVSDPQLRASQLQVAAIVDAARAKGRNTVDVDLGSDEGIERAFGAATAGRTGAIVTSSPSASTRRHVVIQNAERFRFPAVYPGRHHVLDGGLVSYGPDLVEPFRLAAGYIDRILRGERPGDLPVQLPTKLETVLNLRTSRAAGLPISTSLLARADEMLD